jgi:hypothetical protein
MLPNHENGFLASGTKEISSMRFFMRHVGLVAYFIGLNITGLGKPVMAIVQKSSTEQEPCDCRFGNGNDFYFPTVFSSNLDSYGFYGVVWLLQR